MVEQRGMRKDVQLAIATSAILGAAIAIGWCRGFFPPMIVDDVVLSLLATGVVGVWVWAYRHDIERRLTGNLQSTAVPVIAILPLPHKKGVRDMKDRIEVDVNEKREVMWLTEKDPATHPDVNDAEHYSSQTWEARVPVKPSRLSRDGQTAILKRSETRPLIFKFGVVRIKVTGAPAIGCRASMTCRRITGKGRSRVVGPPFGSGEIVWYSRSVRQRIMGKIKSAKEIVESPTTGINNRVNRIAKGVIDINPGERNYHDLQLFYMRNGCPTVFLCGEQNEIVAGKSENGSLVRFQLEVTVSALNHPTGETRKFEATARWDDYTMTEVP